MNKKKSASPGSGSDLSVPEAVEMVGSDLAGGEGDDVTTPALCRHRHRPFSLLLFGLDTKRIAEVLRIGRLFSFKAVANSQAERKYYTRIKKKIKFSSNITKLRMEQLQSHI